MKKLILVLLFASALYAQAPVRFGTFTNYYNPTTKLWQVANLYDTLSLTTHQTVWLPALDIYNGYASIEANFHIGSADSITIFAALCNYPGDKSPSSISADTAVFKLNKVDSVKVVANGYTRKNFSFSGKFGKSVVLWIYNESSTAAALNRLAATIQ